MSRLEAPHTKDQYWKFRERCYKIFEKVGGDWWDEKVAGSNKREMFVSKVWDLPEEERELRIAMLLLGG